MSASGLQLRLAGESVLLEGDRALVWRDCLFLADVHLDKAASFQRRGLAVPLGDERTDLARIAALAARHAVRHVYVLGDLVHAPPAAGGVTEQLLQHWWQHCRDCGWQLQVVVGNHDGDAVRRLAHWPVTWLPAGSRVGPFVLCHEPPARAPRQGVALAGHLHPVTVLRDGRRDRMRLPVFWHRPGMLVLPAFGSFTGGHAVVPEAGDRLYALVDGTVLALPTAC